MSYAKRLEWLLLVLLVTILYFPINRLMTGGNNLKITLDTFIPTLPLFAIPYLLYLPYWIFFYFFAAWKMKDALFRAFISGSLMAVLLATAIYLVFPTYTERPTVPENSWGTWLLQGIYSHDNVYNSFPSEHVLFTALIALFGSQWFPHLRWAFGGSVALVILATLFTGQHHMLDPLGGLVLAYAGYRFGLGMENGFQMLFEMSPIARHNH